MTNSCKICQKPLSEKKRGRPPVYCGTACRRAAEYEIKRVDNRLGELEKQLSDLRSSPPGLYLLTDPTLIAAEIALQRTRLLELLAR